MRKIQRTPMKACTSVDPRAEKDEGRTRHALYRSNLFSSRVGIVENNIYEENGNYKMF